VLGAVLGAPLALLACGSSTSGQIPAAQATGLKIVVTVDGGCTVTLGPAKDVRTDPDGLSQHLLPEHTKPTSSLVCEYTGRSTAQQPLRTRLARSVRLGVHDATRLASAISKVSTKPAHGEFVCPNDQFGTVTIVAFNYADRTVDLWYKWSGCQTLDNGYVLAFQGANASFYSAFQPVFDDLAPLPRQ
jgi:hypothetical protein